MAYSYDQLVGFARNSGFKGQSAYTAAAIGMAESYGNPGAYNPRDPNGSYGIMQINQAAHPGTMAQALDPQGSFDLAYSISRGGTDFTPWSTYTTSNPRLSYAQFLPSGGDGVTSNFTAPPGTPDTFATSPDTGLAYPTDRNPINNYPGSAYYLPGATDGSGASFSVPGASPGYDPAGGGYSLFGLAGVGSEGAGSVNLGAGGDAGLAGNSQAEQFGANTGVYATQNGLLGNLFAGDSAFGQLLPGSAANAPDTAAGFTDPNVAATSNTPAQNAASNSASWWGNLIQRGGFFVVGAVMLAIGAVYLAKHADARRKLGFA